MYYQFLSWHAEKKNEKLQHFDIVVIISIAEFSGSTILGDTCTTN